VAREGLEGGAGGGWRLGGGGWLLRRLWVRLLVWEYCRLATWLRALVAYLFTFWPPGPEDLEKVISHRLRGIVSGFRLASHLRAAERSSSV
jgi:hypothetical protein